MKIKNKSNGVEADVPDALAGVLVAGGGWEKVQAVAEEVVPAKPVRKRAPRKPKAAADSEG